MYKKKYYEASPNREIVANQSHSFFFPPTVPVSNHLSRSYDYSKDYLTEFDLDIHDYYPNIDRDNNGDPIDIHSLLDYTILNDENCISLQMLFSALPTDDNYNLVQHLKMRGVAPNPANN